MLTQGRGDEYEVDVGSNRLDGQPRLSGMTERIHQDRYRFGLPLVAVCQPDADRDVDPHLFEAGACSQLARPRASRDRNRGIESRGLDPDVRRAGSRLGGPVGCGVHHGDRALRSLPCRGHSIE